MLNRRAQFTLVLIAAVYTTLVLLAWALKGVELRYFEDAPVIMHVNGARYPLYLGAATLQLPLLVLALLFLDLANEFFGRPVGMFFAMAAPLAAIVLWAALRYFADVPGVENPDALQGLVDGLFDLSRRHLASLCAGVFVGFTVLSYLHGFFRKLMRSNFSIVRLFMSHLIGIPFAVGALILMQEFPQQPDYNTLATIITQSLQWFLLSFSLFPFYYILYIPFRILAGNAHCNRVKDSYKKKKTPPEEEKTPVPRKKLSLFGGKKKSPFKASSEAQQETSPADLPDPPPSSS